MSNAIEAFRAARKRINPEGLAFSAAATLTSPTIILTVGAGATYAVHELVKDTDTALVRVLAVGVLGLLNVISVSAETKALNSHQYSASPISSTLYILTGKSLLSSLGGHLVNYAQLSILNPINAYAIATKNTELLIESEGAASMVLLSWFIALNTLILRGKTQPFVDGVKRIRETVGSRLKKQGH